MKFKKNDVKLKVKNLKKKFGFLLLALSSRDNENELKHLPCFLKIIELCLFARGEPVYLYIMMGQIYSLFLT